MHPDSTEPRPAGTQELRNFVRDWIIFSPVAVWLAVLVALVTQKNVISEDLSNGALITYAIALTYAYMDDISLRTWDSSPLKLFRFFALLLPLMRYVVTIIAIALVILLLIHREDPDNEVFTVDQNVTLIVSVALSVIALIGAIVVILFRRREERH